MRFLPVGANSMLVELADLEASQALLAGLLADPLENVVELIPGARTLLVRYAHDIPNAPALAASIRRKAAACVGVGRSRDADCLEIPVVYDGPDLDEAARFMGLGRTELIAAHAAATWTAAFCGFAPGFAYLTCEDPRFDVPRRASPRTRVPAGSVALGGRYASVYPQASPGGWQLIGTTELPMFDPQRSPPALIQPGRPVRFSARGGKVYPAPRIAPRDEAPKSFCVVATGFPVLVQDLGRESVAGQGVSSSGAMDRGSLKRANSRVGNDPGAAALEITFGPTVFRAHRAIAVALDGAAERAWIETGTGRVEIDVSRPFAMDGGDELRIPAPASGVRTYLAVRGGFVLEEVLGSSATDTMGNIGPAPLVAGDGLGLADRPALCVDPVPARRGDFPRAGETVTVPVTLGPRTDWLTGESIESLLAQPWEVTAESSRVGVRLSGDPLRRRDPRELPSEGAVKGAVQVPHSGQPVVFMADHPVTGGYPIVAVIAPRALDIVGQLPPGARIRFAADRPFSPIAPEGSR